MSEDEKRDECVDIPISKLVPSWNLKSNRKQYERIEDSLWIVDLIAPLVVHPQGDVYNIQGGFLRYQILQEMGVETVRCRIVKH